MDHNMNILATCNLYKEIILNAHDIFPNPFNVTQQKDVTSLLFLTIVM